MPMKRACLVAIVLAALSQAVGCRAAAPASRPLVVGIADVCADESRPPSVESVMRYDYCRCVYASGNVPFIIPATTNLAGIARSLDRVDVLLLTGGEDVDPARYRAAVSPHCGRVNLSRDAWEFSLLDEAARRRTPTVGICRGHQLINVYFGGTLHQDIPSELPGALVHRSSDLHPISIEPGSRLASVLCATNAMVNTRHHQSVMDVAPGFRVTARAPDGVVEAIEAVDMPVAGVQFHPEDMAATRGEAAFLRFFTRILEWAGGSR